MNLSGTIPKPETTIQDEVIRRKLVIDGDAAGDDRKIQVLVKSLLTFSNCENISPSETGVNYVGLIQGLRQIEYSGRRSLEVIQMNEDACRLFNGLQDSIQKESITTRKVIDEAKIVIEEETKHRKHSMEYEALTKLIETRADRKATEAKKIKLIEDVHNLGDMRIELIEAVQERKKQIRGLGFVAECLHKSIIEFDESRPWLCVSPRELVICNRIDIDPFPLEKDSESFITKGLPDGLIKDKYEDLSEESPEEGESED